MFTKQKVIRLPLLLHHCKAVLFQHIVVVKYLVQFRRTVKFICTDPSNQTFFSEQ